MMKSYASHWTIREGESQGWIGLLMLDMVLLDFKFSVTDGVASVRLIYRCGKGKELPGAIPMENEAT